MHLSWAINILDSLIHIRLLWGSREQSSWKLWHFEVNNWSKRGYFYCNRKFQSIWAGNIEGGKTYFGPHSEYWRGLRSPQPPPWFLHHCSTTWTLSFQTVFCWCQSWSLAWFPSAHQHQIIHSNASIIVCGKWIPDRRRQRSKYPVQLDCYNHAEDNSAFLVDYSWHFRLITNSDLLTKHPEDFIKRVKGSVRQTYFWQPKIWAEYRRWSGT